MISLGFASYSLTLLCHSWTLWGFWCKRTLRQSIKRENTQSDNHKENTSIRTIYSHTFVCFTIPSKCHMREGLKKSYSSKWWVNKFHVLHREVLLVLIANQAFYQLILPKSNTLKAKLWEKKCIWCSKKRKTNELWMIITEKLSKISIKKYCSTMVERTSRQSLLFLSRMHVCAYSRLPLSHTCSVTVVFCPSNVQILPF